MALPVNIVRPDKIKGVKHSKRKVLCVAHKNRYTLCTAKLIFVVILCCINTISVYHYFILREQHIMCLLGRVCEIAVLYVFRIPTYNFVIFFFIYDTIFISGTLYFHVKKIISSIYPKFILIFQ